MPMFGGAEKSIQGLLLRPAIAIDRHSGASSAAPGIKGAQSLRGPAAATAQRESDQYVESQRMAQRSVGAPGSAHSDRELHLQEFARFPRLSPGALESRPGSGAGIDPSIGQ